MTERTAITSVLVERLPAAVTTLPVNWPVPMLIGRISLLLILFVVMSRFLQGSCHLSADGYDHAVLVIELMQQVGGLRLLLIAVCLLGLLKFGALWSRWDDFDHGHQLRWFIVFLAGLVAWPFATLGYNYYFDQAYLVDRILLLAALVGLWWRPVFVLAFLPVSMVIMYQLVEPAMGGTILAHKQQVLRVLVLFAAAFLVHALSGSRRSSDFIFLTCCLVAGAYWEAALAKIELDWISFGNIHHALFASHAHGWLASLQDDEIASFGQMLALLDWPMRVFVLGIEAGCLFFLWRRTLSVGLLVCVAVFHLGVFAIFGFLFWTWILLDMALLVLLLRHGSSLFREIHDWPHFLLSAFLIAVVGIWAAPPHLGWFDTRLSYTLRYTAVGESGTTYALSPRFFAPYGDVFAMSAFGYLVRDHARLTGPYGVTKDRVVAERIEQVSNADDVFDLEVELGQNQYDPARAETYENFLTRYLEHWNAAGHRRSDWSSIAPPPQFWSSLAGSTYVGQEAIRELQIDEVTRLFEDGSQKTLRVVQLARITVPVTKRDARR